MFNSNLKDRICELELQVSKLKNLKDRIWGLELQVSKLKLLHSSNELRLSVLESRLAELEPPTPEQRAEVERLKDSYLRYGICR